ncbi:MAG: FHA domain-containing protein [Oscillatoriales cyanobacterium C42_A2020_001]|nr:FHA domain-containing protein [Leptolyngbyaceae cyanobacterium C42_A2020_001]
MQSIPVQSWTFEQESTIRIGRSTDNHVILYSAVVSRHHVEIRKVESGWEIVNLGANGTYLDGRRITQVPVDDGVIIRLARSGPNVQIHLTPQSAETSHSAMGEKTVGQNAKHPVSVASVGPTEIPEMDVDVVSPPAEVEAYVTTESQEEGTQPAKSSTASFLGTTVQADDAVNPAHVSHRFTLSACCHQFVDSGHLFCLECGKPLKPLGVVGDYQLVKVLEEDELSTVQLAWKDGKAVVLTTLLPNWAQLSEAVELFEQEARLFLAINHPALPRFLDVFSVAGQPYLVMEPVYGRSLRQVVTTESPLTQKVAIARILEVCAALDYLHAQTPPILHQRIKPEYLIQRSATTPLMVTGLTPGRLIAPLQASAEYAAPEQQQGQASFASDLYAIGPTLVFLLTGKSPAAFYAQREQGFRFYAEYVPGLTPDLAAVIRKLTNLQPTERFASGQELAEALQQIQNSSIEI